MDDERTSSPAFPAITDIPVVSDESCSGSESESPGKYK